MGSARVVEDVRPQDHTRLLVMPLFPPILPLACTLMPWNVTFSRGREEIDCGQCARTAPEACRSQYEAVTAAAAVACPLLCRGWVTQGVSVGKQDRWMEAAQPRALIGGSGDEDL